MAASSPRSLTRLDRLWLAEAVRLSEAQRGALDDADANRRARAAGGDLGRRILTRAELLARRGGLEEGLWHWRRGATVAAIALAVLAILGGFSLAAAAVGDGNEPVNLAWALGTLLGLHLVTLIGWLGSLLSRGGPALAEVWLWLSGKLARDARAAQLAPALLVLLSRHGLMRWGFGALVHGFWLISLSSAWLGLLALFSAREYGFVWESTLLTADSFSALVAALGALPAALGFGLPELESLAAGSGTVLTEEGVRQAWAAWVLGALLTYGLLPRALLGAACLWRWRRGLANLTLAVDEPDYVLLAERLMPASEELAPREPVPAVERPSVPQRQWDQGAGALLLAVELDPASSWPPALPEGVAYGGTLDSRAERTRALDTLAAHPPARLVVACDPRRTVDRGTLRLIGELAGHAREIRVWLVGTAPPVRVGEWREQLAEQGVELADQPLPWLAEVANG